MVEAAGAVIDFAVFLALNLPYRNIPGEI